MSPRRMYIRMNVRAGTRFVSKMREKMSKKEIYSIFKVSL